LFGSAPGWQTSSNGVRSEVSAVLQARRYGSRSRPSEKPLFITCVPALQNGLAVEA
jgi:hypothetical protein